MTVNRRGLLAGLGASLILPSRASAQSTVTWASTGWYYLDYNGMQPGGTTWIVQPDNMAIVNPLYRVVPVSSWMPRKVFISRVWGGYWQDAPSPTNRDRQYDRTEMTIWTDPKGIGYKSAPVPGDEGGSDYSRDTSLIHDVEAEDARIIEKEFRYPVLWDRDRGDLFMFSLSSNYAMSWIYFEIQFVVPVSVQPTAPGPTW